MKRIPALLLSVSVSVSTAFFPAAVRAEPLDINPEPVYDDILPLSGNLPRSGGSIKGEVGPKTNQLKFPNLTKENSFYANEESARNALPAELIDELKFQEGAKIEGKIGHSTCKVEVIKYTPTEGEPIIEKYPDSRAKVDTKSTGFTAPKEFSDLILRTRFWQSVFVPNQSSDLDFRLSPPSLPDEVELNKRLTECQRVNDGVSLGESTAVRNDPPSPLGGFANFLASVFDSIKDFLLNLVKGVNVTFVASVQEVKYLPGETKFEKQTVGKEGFLGFFKPEGVPFSKAGDEKEQVPYVAGEDRNRTVEINYSGVASFKSGTLDLVKSLYPEGMAPASLVSVVPAPGTSEGLTFTIPYRDTSVGVSETKKQEIIRGVRASFPETRIEELWNTVVNKALDAGINPAFALAVWIEESAASDRKIERDNPRGYSAFGCFPSGETLQVVPFEKSLDCFLNFTAKEKGTDFVEWVRYFCGPGAVPICSNNPNFLRRIKDYYDKLIPPGTPGAATPIGTQF